MPRSDANTRTNTTPTSGNFGFWNRTGTIISPITSGDDLTASNISAIQGNIVINGTFDTDSDWNLNLDGGGDTFVISGGICSIVVSGPATNTMAPSVALAPTVGKFYTVSFDLVFTLGNTFKVDFGGGAQQSFTTSGTKTFSLECTSVSTLIFTATSAKAGMNVSIDNVSINQSGIITGEVDSLGGSLSNVTVKSSLVLDTNGEVDVGSDDLGVKTIYLGNDLTSAVALPNFRGLASKGVSGDIYIGCDNVFPGFYVQKTVAVDSTKDDNTDDITNLYQGNSTFPRIGLMFAIEWNEDETYIGTNGVELGNSATEPPPLVFGDSLGAGLSTRTGGEGWLRGDTPNREFHVYGIHGVNGTTQKVVGDVGTTIRLRAGDGGDGFSGNNNGGNGGSVLISAGALGAKTGSGTDGVIGTIKIALSTAEKIGFWNTTPVSQPSHIADATGGATVDAEARTAINAILAQLASTGLQAAS